MRQPSSLLRLAIFCMVFVICAVQAEEVASPSTQVEAQTWLKKVQSAAQQLNYSGVFVYQQGSHMRTSRITHVLSGKNEMEKLEILDGKPREYIRNNDDVVCYIPQAKTVQIEKRATRDVFPAILATNPSDLSRFYSVTMGKAGRVAGRDSQAIVLEPKDASRYGYRLWADTATGLLLRAQTLDAKHEVIEQISFTQVETGNIDISRVKPSYAKTPGWHVEDSTASRADLSQWSVKAPPGFEKIQEVKRLISDTQGTDAGVVQTPVATRREVSQIVFSDGMAAISVFIEPSSEGGEEGSMQQGAMNIVGRRQGDYWLTVVGEVPGSVIRQVANSIQLKSK